MSKTIRRIASLVFVVVLSIPSMSFAYNAKHSASGGLVHWQQHKVSLRIDPRLETLLADGQVRAAVNMATDAWRGFSNVPDIAIEDGAPPAYDPDHRGNGIYLMDKWPFQPNQLAVTVLTYAGNGDVLGVDVLVNGEKSFALLNEAAAPDSAAEHYDLGAVLTHELGHVLGLDESYDHPEATMFPQIHAGEVRPRVLSTDDENGVMDVYHDAAVAEAAAAAPAGCSVSQPHGTHGLAGLLSLVLGALVVVARRRNRAR